MDKGGGQPFDLVSGYKAAHTVPVWTPVGVQQTVSASTIGFTRSTRIEPSSTVTALCGLAAATTQAQAPAAPFCKTFNNNGVSPFVSYDVEFGTPSAGQCRANIALGGTLKSTSGVTYTANPQLAGLRYTGAELDLILGNKIAATTSVSGSITYDTSTTGDLYICSPGRSGANLTGTVYWVAIWSRPLSLAELRSVNQNPYQFLVPPAPMQRYWVSAPGAAALPPCAPIWPQAMFRSAYR